MTSPPYVPAGSAFLVERYLSHGHIADLSAAVARLAKACHDTTATDAPVWYVHSTFVPAEETCFCLLQAPSVGAVSAVNTIANFAFDRISEAQIIRFAALPPEA